MNHTDFFLQRKTLNSGEVVEFRKCSSCGAIMIGEEPWFNLYCMKASENERRRLNNIKKQL